jgi:hypothetical protein
MFQYVATIVNGDTLFAREVADPSSTISGLFSQDGLVIVSFFFSNIFLDFKGFLQNLMYAYMYLKLDLVLTYQGLLLTHDYLSTAV